MGAPTVIKTLEYVITEQAELNSSYLPFIKGGGLFIPTEVTFYLDDAVNVELTLMGESFKMEGKVVWITPKNSIYHIHVGVGIELTGQNAKNLGEKIRAKLDGSALLGGYAYGLVAG